MDFFLVFLQEADVQLVVIGCSNVKFVKVKFSCHFHNSLKCVHVFCFRAKLILTILSIILMSVKGNI